MIKGILFDYGGTIDTNGRHWANVLWEAYQKNNVDIPKEQFLEAYAFGERALAIHPIIKPDHGFADVLSLKLQQQFVFLGLPEAEQNKISALVEDSMTLVRNSIAQALPILQQLATSYSMALVSNFYGNIQTVLADFSLTAFFKEIVESAVVGVRKPDPAIYALGVKALNLPTAEVLVVGDSYKKDMVPAKAIGCKTVWINVDGFEDDYQGAGMAAADDQITDFAQLPAVLARWA